MELYGPLALDPESGRGDEDRRALELMAPGALRTEPDKGFDPSTFNLGRARLPSQPFPALINHVKILAFNPGWDSNLPRL